MRRMNDVLGDRKCPECGKAFTALYPHLWAYRRDKVYSCSWHCLRADEKRKEGNNMRLTLENKKKAVEIAIEGGDPLRYLAEHGCANPAAMWYKIKADLKDVDPEKAAQLPKRIAANKVDKGMPKELKLEGGVDYQVAVAETPEEPKKIVKPVNYDGLLIREVEGVFGRYRRTDVGGKIYIDFEPFESMDVLSFTVEQWRNFREELEKAAKILGVEI